MRGYPAEDQHRRSQEQDESMRTMRELRDDLEQLKARLGQR
jgi:hypothetical protein